MLGRVGLRHVVCECCGRRMRLAGCTVQTQTVTTSRASSHDHFIYARISRSIAGSPLPSCSIHCGASCETCRRAIGCVLHPRIWQNTCHCPAWGGDTDDEDNSPPCTGLLQVILRLCMPAWRGSGETEAAASARFELSAAVCSHVLAVQPFEFHIVPDEQA